MKLTTTLLNLIFFFQISAQDSLMFFQMDYTYEIFEIESPVLLDPFSKNNNNSIHRYQLREIKSTPLLTKRIVSIGDVYNINLGFEEPLDSRFFFKSNGYTFWTKPKHFDFIKWNYSTNLGYRKSQNIFLNLNENGVIIAHIFPRENYFRSGFETHFSKSDFKMHLNFSYSNGIYSYDFNRPSSFVSSRFNLDLPKNFAEQRFINWVPIRFALFNNAFDNRGRMSLNFVMSSVRKFLIKAEVESNFIFFINSREHLQTFTVGLGARPAHGTLIFINRSNFIKHSTISRNVLSDPQLTINIRQQLAWRIFSR